MGLFLTEEQYEEEIKFWENKFVKQCPKCNGTAVIKTEDGFNGCSCERKAMIYANLISNGIPRSYITWDWSMCEDKNIVKKCQHYIQNFEANFNNCKGMYIFGTQGVGKTTLSAIIAKYIAMRVNPHTQKKFQVAFASYDKLVTWNNNKFDREKQDKLYTFINKAHLIVIDNVGAEPGLESDSKNTTKLLDSILRDRRNNGYPTIISSNFTVDEIKKHYSDTVKDFIEQNSILVPVIGDNYRTKDNVNNILKDIEDLEV